MGFNSVFKGLTDKYELHFVNRRWNIMALTLVTSSGDNS